jgi:glycyl-radical enzyme activating protein family
MKTIGTVFNIQKFSLHDGPGIRTTIFLKGCPLRCQWCANPESWIRNIQIFHNEKKCRNCNTCLSVCPNKAITLTNQNTINIDKNHCLNCLNCVKHCEYKAFTNIGENQTINEILEIILQDQAFYEESNGGVTLSGGEALMQDEFIEKLAIAIKNKKIHLAVETSGYVKHSHFKKVASLFDLLLFDLKHYDSTKHYQGTKVHNQLIIQNLQWALKHNINTLIRIPVIPNFNNSLNDAKGFSQLIKTIGATSVQLLPFHQFGENKYDLYKIDYPYKNTKALYTEDLKDYQKIFLNSGIDCFF